MIRQFSTRAFDAKPRHFCRNCRTKLAAPVDNQHHAFCVGGCHKTFYNSRCIVCEGPIRRRAHNKRHCGRHRCRTELRQYPHAYAYPTKIGLPYTTRRADVKSAHSTGTKTADFDFRWGIYGSPPEWCGLGHWWWGDPLKGTDLSLYDGEGLTVARIVRVEGAYELRAPITWPRRKWTDLRAAKRGAESIALAGLSPVPEIRRALDRMNGRWERANGKWTREGGQPAPLSASGSWATRRRTGAISYSTKVPADDPGPIPDLLRRAA
jgi:hypothetical protein